MRADNIVQNSHTRLFGMDSDTSTTHQKNETEHTGVLPRVGGAWAAPCPASNIQQCLCSPLVTASCYRRLLPRNPTQCSSSVGLAGVFFPFPSSFPSLFPWSFFFLSSFWVKLQRVTTLRPNQYSKKHTVTSASVSDRVRRRVHRKKAAANKVSWHARRVAENTQTHTQIHANRPTDTRVCLVSLVPHTQQVRAESF